MLDDALEHQRTLREGPAWRPLPESVKATFDEPAPDEGLGAERVYRDFLERVLPYNYGNVHPRSWGWVNGQGSPLGTMAEMLAATMNPNCWGGEHAPAYVEAQVLAWMRQRLGLPDEAGGLLVSGGSVATLVGLAAARQDRMDGDVARTGLAGDPAPVVYASSEVHNSVDKAVALLGIGTERLRRVPVGADYRMDVGALRELVARDRDAGLLPLAVVATAGTVNTGAVDDLDAVADVCADEGLWLHVDGAIGGMLCLSPALRPLLAGVERADSVSFDLHKWMYVPIEAGCVLVRRPDALRATFSPPANYLAAFERGPAAGRHFYAPLGPQLTRGFRALKVWFYMRAFGTAKLGRLVEQNVRQARALAGAVEASHALELLAPVPLNIVCFRYRGGGGGGDLDALNRELLQRLWESGVAEPSSTVLEGRFALRCAFTNHRTRMDDIALLVATVERLGRELEAAAPAPSG